MASMHGLTTTWPDSANGRTAPRAQHELGLARSGRNVRRTELAAGLATIVTFALIGLLWHLRSVDRTAVLALAAAVGQGEVIDASDLRLTHLSSDNPLAALRPEDADRVVGRTAVADLAAGTLLTHGLVADTTELGADEGVFGLMLEPGQYPASDLAVGDTVDVVVGGTSTPAGRAEVADVQDLAGGERKLVSLRAAGGQASTLAGVDQASVRLVQVAP